MDAVGDAAVSRLYSDRVRHDISILELCAVQSSSFVLRLASDLSNDSAFSRTLGKPTSNLIPKRVRRRDSLVDGLWALVSMDSVTMGITSRR